MHKLDFCNLNTSNISLGASLGGSVVKNPPVKPGDLDLIPGSGRSPGEGNGNPLQYSCLEESHGQRNLGGYSPRGSQELTMIE